IVVFGGFRLLLWIVVGGFTWVGLSFLVELDCSWWIVVGGFTLFLLGGKPSN
ncbi:8860_t:CDS:2, partial [Dentiscutata erythropus]